MYNVSDIRKFIHEREKGRLKVYEEILEKCFHRIQNAVVRDEPWALFVVPDFVIGKPKYNFAHCIQYVIFRLKQNGFELKYFYPNALQIYWGKTDFQSMLAIESDRGTLNTLAIENKPNSSPSLFDMKAPHTGEGLGLLSKKGGKQKRTVDDGRYMGISDKGNEFTIKFKDPEKENKKKLIQEEKFRAINSFLPKTNIFANKNKL